MPVEIGPEWDPAAHDYGNGTFFASTADGRLAATIMGLVGLSAFAGGVGIGAFVTYSAAATGAIGTPITVTYAVGGTTLVFTGGTTITSQQAAFIATVQSGGLASEPIAVMAILSSYGFRLMSLADIIALGLFERVLQQGYFNNISNWMGGPPGGGSPIPPGFPGFGLGGPNNGLQGGTYGCITHSNPPVVECKWYH